MILEITKITGEKDYILNAYIIIHSNNEYNIQSDISVFTLKDKDVEEIKIINGSVDRNI